MEEIGGTGSVLVEAVSPDDVNGNFSLEVPDGAEILVISYIGMLAQEIEIGAATSFNITMTEDLIKKCLLVRIQSLLF